MKKIASVDIGTNSVLYSLFEASGASKLRDVYFERHSPRIGSKLKGAKRQAISKESYAHLLKIMRRIVSHAEKNSADAILVAATNPLRIAANGKDVKENLEWDLGIPVEILTSEREADLSFLGAVGPLKKDKEAMIIDLGGGSTEFVIYRGARRRVFESLPEGAVSLTEVFDSAGKIDASRFGDYLKYLDRYTKTAKSIAKKVRCPITLVGGTSSTLGWLLDKEIMSKPRGVALSRKNLALLVDILGGLNLSCRRELLAIDKKRAEIIFAGAFWLLYLFNTMEIGKAQASPRGLRHGLALDFLLS
ncbi:MAG: hypothetical protein R3F48_05850 [Candidatus Zixiibacteriota bacterium]